MAPVEWGMSLQQFNDFVAACRATDYWPVAAQKGHVNLYEVVEFFVKPWTRRTGCSVALRMNSAPARAELMVSHSWQECMDQCSEALGKFCARHKQIASSLAVALWFCAFAQYQPGSEPGDRGPTVAEQLALDPFGSVIRSLRDGLGMVVVQTSMGDVYSRLWCVYEISEVVSSQAKVSMAYSHRALERRAGSFEDMLRTRTSGATCSSVLDEEMIRKKVEQTGGFKQLDSIIFNFRLLAFQEMMNELNEFTRDQLHQEIQIITEKMMGARPTQELVAIADCQLEKASEYQRSGVKQTLLCFCLAPLVILAAIGALPFIVLCAPCICVYYRRKRMAADLCAEIFDLEQFAYSDHVELERKSTRRKDRPPPPPPASTFGRSEALEEELGSESDGEESEDDDALLQRLKLAQQVAPQLFSKSPS